MATYCNKSHAQPESESTDVASSPAAMKTGFNASVRAREEEMSGLVYRVHAVPETVNDFLFDFGAAALTTRMIDDRSMSLQRSLTPVDS